MPPSPSQYTAFRQRGSVPTGLETAGWDPLLLFSHLVAWTVFLTIDTLYTLYKLANLHRLPSGTCAFHPVKSARDVSWEHRRVCVFPTVPLNAVRAMRRAHGCTVNQVGTMVMAHGCTVNQVGPGTMVVVCAAHSCTTVNQVVVAILRPSRLCRCFCGQSYAEREGGMEVLVGRCGVVDSADSRRLSDRR